MISSFVIPIIFIGLTILCFLGLTSSLLALFVMPLEPGRTYGPLGISNPPLVMLLVWGSICLFVLYTTIKLIQKKRVGFYFGVTITLISVLLSMLAARLADLLLGLCIVALLIIARADYS